MQQAAEKLGLDYDIKAFPYAKIRDEGPKADVILLGPQIRYNLKHVEKDYPTMPVILMDMRLYAAMDGEAMVRQAQAAFGKIGNTTEGGIQMQQELTNVSCEIIAKVGTAKGLFVEAIETAAAGQLDQARALLSEGEQIFNQGHEAHGQLLTQFAAGAEVKVDLLLVHAECQMMSAEDFKVIAEEVIAIAEKRIHA